jgi:hypothetical protein
MNLNTMQGISENEVAIGPNKWNTQYIHVWAFHFCAFMGVSFSGIGARCHQNKCLLQGIDSYMTSLPAGPISFNNMW